MVTRLFLLVALAFCLAFSANGQVSVGTSVGANMSFSRWYIKPLNIDLGYDPALGYRAAAVANWHLGSVIALRAEAGYQIWRNSLDVFFTSSSGTDDVNGTAHQSFQNWSGSLLANITPFSSKNIYFMAGPTVAVITGAWYSADKSLLEPGWPATTDIDLKNYNRTQVFADFGAGVQFPTGTLGNVFAEMRYQLALTDLAGVSTVNAGINSLGMNVGYLFKL
ncbi:MAG: outer membrane beta-barrel protein [Saprospiraceae bacterium]